MSSFFACGVTPQGASVFGVVARFFPGRIKVKIAGSGNKQRIVFPGQKIMQIVPILPHLEGKSGILNMENFDENTVNIPFNMD